MHEELSVFEFCEVKHGKLQKIHVSVPGQTKDVDPVTRSTWQNHKHCLLLQVVHQHLQKKRFPSIALHFSLPAYFC